MAVNANIIILTTVEREKSAFVTQNNKRPTAIAPVHLENRYVGTVPERMTAVMMPAHTRIEAGERNPE